ncbi:hypothetical protein [Kribbella solani]|uniref:hypothetical protein n=1 Tax=Kribbella solani TaxID=236067 RepID=UPI0029A3A63A|nr:hypothetical protein [Kribbella solani]MDX2974668.1 hypothetical protein [Kribbella solani]
MVRTAGVLPITPAAKHRERKASAAKPMELRVLPRTEPPPAEAYRAQTLHSQAIMARALQAQVVQTVLVQAARVRTERVLAQVQMEVGLV